MVPKPLIELLNSTQDRSSHFNDQKFTHACGELNHSSYSRRRSKALPTLMETATPGHEGYSAQPAALSQALQAPVF